MKLIKSLIKEKRVVMSLIFILFLLFNLCGTEALASLFQSRDYSETTLKTHDHSRGESHPQDSRQPGDNEEVSCCCSISTAQNVTVQQTLRSAHLKNCSGFDANTFFNYPGKTDEFFLVQGAFQSSDPPKNSLFETFFLAIYSSHAPPAASLL